LETVVEDATVLASNTSSLLVSAIAAGCRLPGRVAGLHFFNPVPLMKIAEVIPGLQTVPAVTARLCELVRRAGHRPVVAADQPGFLINHAGRALYTEGLRIVEECVTDVAGVDAIMRDSCGFRMGPFELLDLTGLDVSGKVMQSIFDQFQGDPRYRPSSLVPPRIAAGLFGRKTMRGFYLYPSGVRSEPPEPPAPDAIPGTLWIGDSDGTPALADRLSNVGARIVEAPEDADALLVLPWGEDVTGAAVRLGLDPVRTVALDPLIGWGKRQVLMRSPATDPAIVRMVHGWLSAAGAKVTLISDSVGLVAQRVLAMIVNTGCEIAQRGIASPEDIDAAVCIGLGYPSGPLAWGDAIGPARVFAILQGLQAASGDPRYRPSPWLRRRALLGLSLTMTEQAATYA
jgi:3-hydroxybutyryl-CoA dehydrogenase